MHLKKNHSFMTKVILNCLKMNLKIPIKGLKNQKLIFDLKCYLNWHNDIFDICLKPLLVSEPYIRRLGNPLETMTLQDYVTIHLQLPQIDILEVIILLMICLIEHVFQTKQVLDLSVFNMMARISNLKISTKHVSCRCKYKFDGKICNLNQKWNNNKCWCECKYPREQDACKKDYICNPATL